MWIAGTVRNLFVDDKYSIGPVCESKIQYKTRLWMAGIVKDLSVDGKYSICLTSTGIYLLWMEIQYRTCLWMENTVQGKGQVIHVCSTGLTKVGIAQYPTVDGTIVQFQTSDRNYHMELSKLSFVHVGRVQRITGRRKVGTAQYLTLDGGHSSTVLYSGQRSWRASTMQYPSTLLWQACAVYYRTPEDRKSIVKGTREQCQTTEVNGHVVPDCRGYNAVRNYGGQKYSTRRRKASTMLYRNVEGTMQYGTIEGKNSIDCGEPRVQNQTF